MEIENKKSEIAGEKKKIFIPISVKFLSVK